MNKIASAHQLGPMLRLPSSKSDESLLGYIFRVGKLNGCSSLQHMYSLVGKEGMARDGGWPWLYESTPNRQKMQVLFDGMEANWPSVVENQLQLFGLEYPARYIKFKYPKFCPACLAESSHHRWYWDLAHVTVCLKHQLLLMDRCLGCRKRLYWDREMLSFCACGCDWTQVDGQAVAESNELYVTRRVLAFCGFGQQREEGSFLDTLDLVAFLDTTFFAASLYLLSQKKWKLTLKKQNHIFHLGLTEACALLADPPQSFFAFLDALYPDERKRILPLCKDYLGQSAGPLTTGVSEYVEGFPDRRQMRMAFGEG